MTHRYSLRFDTGERQGEVVPVASARFTVGRRPGNSLQIIENSVSGQHAEFVSDPQGVILRDLGSTNGTRVGNDRALEMRVLPGSQVFIGNVGMTLLDAELVGAEDDAAVPSGPTGAIGDDEGFQVSTEDLERAAKGSRSGLLLVVAVGALVGAGGWYFARGAGSGAQKIASPVETIPGNLLKAGYSFESAADESGARSPRTWSPRENAPASFLETPSAAVSGSVGLRADLGPGEWAVHASDEVRVVPGRLLRLGAVLSGSGAGSARVGVELAAAGTGSETDDGEATVAPGLMTAWSNVVEGERGRAVTLEVAVPPGYRRARVVLLGSAATRTEGGVAEADDAWLVMQSGGAPTATLDEFKFFGLGDPMTVAALYRVDDLLVSGLRARATGSPMGAGIGAWEATPDGNGIVLRPSGVSGPVTLHLRAEDEATAGGVAMMAADGYERHGGEFDRTGVTDLLLGKGLSLVRFRFDPPARVKGRPSGSAIQFTCDLTSAAPITLQLKFREELAAAANLAHDAEQAEAAGQLGTCMARWQELLDSYPFDERHVVRAEETRGRLVLAGLAEARELAGQIERARFFRLIDLYRECLASSTELAERYAGSEVEPEARRMAGELRVEIAALEVGLDRHEKARLTGILRTLERQGADRLAGQVRSYLVEHFGESSPEPTAGGNEGGQ